MTYPIDGIAVRKVTPSAWLAGMGMAFLSLPTESRVAYGRLVNVKVLIDAIVRQNMVLVAQLSTAAGLRAPLAHVANDVFLDLVAELESQGVRQRVIADMFGLALRSY